MMNNEAADDGLASLSEGTSRHGTINTGKVSMLLDIFHALAPIKNAGSAGWRLEKKQVGAIFLYF